VATWYEECPECGSENLESEPIVGTVRYFLCLDCGWQNGKFFPPDPDREFRFSLTAD